MQAASAIVSRYLKPPTAISVTTPLDKVPPKGVTVGLLEGNLSALQVYTAGFKAATAALGWKLDVLPYDYTNPTALSDAMEQAVSQKVNFIAVIGQQSSQFSAGLAAAQAANIPIVELIDGSVESVKDIIGCVVCVETGPDGKLVSSTYEYGNLLGNFAVVDSHAAAQALYVTAPSQSGLVPLAQGFTAALATCGKCSVNTLGFAMSDLGSGSIASQVVAYLQAHPQTNYLFFAFGGAATGVRQALDSAGVGKNVKILTSDPEITDSQAIISGQETATVAAPGDGEVGWRAIDIMARYEDGMKLSPSQDSPLPSQLWTSTSIPRPARAFEGTAGYQDQYKKLWLVG